MVARFGVRQDEPAGSSRALAIASSLALAASIAGCAGKDLVVAGERPRDVPSEDDPEGVGGIISVPDPDVTLTGSCPPSPEERMARDGCWPPRHVGRWRGYFIGTPLYETPDGASAEFPIGDLVLNLDEDGAGTLTFGVPPEGVAASDRPLVPCAPGDVAPECPVWASVLANFAYQLDQLALFDPEQAKVPTRFNGEPLPQRAEHMDFVVHAGEPWDTWCTQEPEIEDRCTGGDCGSGDGLPPSAAAFEHPLEQGVAPSGCRCDAAECRADGPLLSISLQMAGIEERPVLRGTYTATDPRIGSATLEFAKDRYP